MLDKNSKLCSSKQKPQCNPGATGFDKLFNLSSNYCN